MCEPIRNEESKKGVMYVCRRNMYLAKGPFVILAYYKVFVDGVKLYYNCAEGSPEN